MLCVRTCCVCVCVCVCINFCKFLRVFYFIQARETLSAENDNLREQLREAKIKINALQQHLEVIRGHTIGFILEQMNTLHIETIEISTIIPLLFLYILSVFIFHQIIIIIVYVFQCVFIEDNTII